MKVNYVLVVLIVYCLLVAIVKHLGLIQRWGTQQVFIIKATSWHRKISINDQSIYEAQHLSVGTILSTNCWCENLRMSWRTWRCFMLSLSTIFMEISFIKPTDSLQAILYAVSWVILTTVAKCLLAFPALHPQMRWSLQRCGVALSSSASSTGRCLCGTSLSPWLTSPTCMCGGGWLVLREKEPKEVFVAFWNSMEGWEVMSLNVESYPVEWDDNFVPAVTWWSLTL